MFTSARRDSYLKQPVPFIASLWLQCSVLVILCGISSRPMSGPSIHHAALRPSLVTPIYFHKDAIASSSIPVPMPSETRVEAKPLSDAKPDTELEAANQAETADDSSSKDEGQGLVPFASWRMNSMPNGFTGMHHQIKTALPVFTPEPPILHSEIPELARGRDVVLEVVIDDQGSIAQVQVLQAVGYGVEDSIMQTLRRWIFVPAKINGVAIASRRQLRFHFPG